MTTSEQINDIAAALAKAQGQMKNAALNKVNPHFKSKYADLAGIRDTVIPALTANGIAAVQTLDVLGAEGVHSPYVITRLIHASGQWIESRCPIPGGKNMQEMGSGITYARRYSLSAICGIAADEDDDANAVSQPAKPRAVETSPDGYADWLDDLDALADEGSEALKAAWTKSAATYRKHLTDTNNAKWEALKAKAAKVKVSA
jgi:hypothetical protein